MPVFDSTFFLLIPAMIFAAYAQFKVKSVYAKYSRLRSSLGYTGRDAAHAMLSLSPETAAVSIERTGGLLTDHYDPRTRTLRLSGPVHDSPSLASVGIAAHEAGHALQHAGGYFPMQIRSLIVPAASIGSTMAFPLFFLGVIFSFRPLLDLGILLFAGAVLFYIITLPVEYNASSRAVALLTQANIITEGEAPAVRQVLSAAALTYLASAAVALVNLVRMLMWRSRD